MLRFVISLIIGLAVGAIIGLYLGWVQFPVQVVNSPARYLSERAKNDYMVMVAAGFLEDGDLGSAVDRLRLLGVPNIPAYIQQVTESYISNSQDVNDISYLVGLAEAVGRLTPIMQPYRRVSVPGS